jgi:putative MATE family efflux protein
MRPAMRKNLSVDMTSGPITGPLILYILPLIGSGVFQQLYNTVDFIFVGNTLNKIAAAAVGACSSLIYCTIGLFLGISVGTSVVISHAFGANDSAKADKALHTSVTFGMIGGAALSVLTIAFAPQILRVLNTPESVIPPATTYMRIYMLSVPASVLYNMCSGAVRAIGNSVTPFRILAVCGIVNVALDALFLIVIPMGIAGVAWATLISQFLSAVLIAAFLHRKDGVLNLRLSGITMDLFILKGILRIGLPAGIQTMLITVSNIMVQYYVNGFGEVAIAAFATYYKLENFVYLPILAFGQASTAFTGQNTGAGLYSRIRKGSNILLLLCAAVTVTITGAILLFPGTVFGWFMKDPEVVRCAITIAMVSFPFYWMYSFIEVYGGSIRGMGFSITSMLIIVSNICVLRIALLMIFSVSPGTVKAVAAVYPMTWGGAAVCFLVAFLWIMRKKRQTSCIAMER